jgi:hypothetical protein
MPESRNRAKHHHHQHPHRPQNPSMPVRHNTLARARKSAAFVVSILAAVLGLAVAFFTQGADAFWLIAGTLGGAIIGYLVGRSMDKSIQKEIRK